MLAIKLRPVGKKKQISYRVVVMEKKSKLVGKFIEDLGWYNPHTNLFSLKNERVEHWIKSGAQPTDSIHNILVKAKLQEGPKIAKHGKSKKEAPKEESNKEQEEIKTEPVIQEVKTETVAPQETQVESAETAVEAQKELKEEEKEVQTPDAKEEGMNEEKPAEA